MYFFVSVGSSDAGVYLHQERGGEIRSHVVTRWELTGLRTLRKQNVIKCYLSVLPRCY